MYFLLSWPAHKDLFQVLKRNNMINHVINGFIKLTASKIIAH